MSVAIDLSAYTPSNVDPELLKRIFVQREAMFELIVNRLTISLTTGDKHHLLLVGPRGSGKTHLVSLTLWELRKNPKLSDLMRIAWLGEDDVHSGFVHLAFAIAKSLADAYPTEFPLDFKSSVRGLSQDDAGLAVMHSVVKNLKHRHLLLVTENLDQTFRGLGEMGQRKLRAFLQETRRIATLSTTSQLFAGVSSRDETFFGFFEPFHLKPLTSEEAFQLIRNIAVEQKCTDLLQFLNTRQAYNRVRALHHLTGGNHRIFVLLSKFLTHRTLDDLEPALERLAEEMTPHFQERMRSLPDQQRQLIQCLCNANGALTVKVIAEETFISEGICSKQLGNLKASGYVRSQRRGKESFYDVSEPLLRLCLETKNQRVGPLRLVSAFLRAWFAADAVWSSLGANLSSSCAADYCQIASENCGTIDGDINSILKTKFNAKIAAGYFSEAMALADELSVSNRIQGLFWRCLVFFRMDDIRASLTNLSEILRAPNLLTAPKAMAHFLRAYSFGLLGNAQEAVADYATVIDLLDVPLELKATALVHRGLCYRYMKQPHAALADYMAVIELPDISEKIRTKALFESCSINWQNLNCGGSLNEFRSFIDNREVTPEMRAISMFAVAQHDVAEGSLDEAVTSLGYAFDCLASKTVGFYGLNSSLLTSILKRGPEQWADYVIAITPLYIRYGTADELGQAITQSIQSLDEAGLSASQLDSWNHVWQGVGKDCDELRIPLACLAAATEILKSPLTNDRPLFRLPLEIRQLIRPLLRKTLREI